MTTPDPANPAFPHAPINEAPLGLGFGDSIRLAALHEPLAGIELGAYDERVLRWLAEVGETSTVMTLASLLHRARAAQPLPAADTEIQAKREDGDA